MLACLTGSVFLIGSNNALLAAPALKYVPPTIQLGKVELEESQPEKVVPGKEVATTILPTDARTVRRLIRQLDADTFADRQAASESLKEMGEPVIALLEEATAQGTGEVISRSVDILKHYTKSGDIPLSQSAMASLERIAEGENKSAAQLAKTVVDQVGSQPGSNTHSRFRVPGANQANRPLRPFMPNRDFINNVQSISVQRNNGDLIVEVVEKDRKVEIDQKLNNKISITITETGRAPRKIEAKDANELKQKDEQAFQLFDKYTKQGAAPFNAPGAPRFGPPAGFGKRPFGGGAGQAFVEMEKHMKEVRARHQQMIQEMKELQRQGGFFQVEP